MDPHIEIRGTPQKPPTARGCLLLVFAALGLTAALCTIFALVVSVAMAWTEHEQAQWPEATARVQQCNLEIYTQQRRTYWIKCSITYDVRGAEFMSRIHSRSTPDPRRVIFSKHPSEQFDLMQDWVDAHPEGTPISVHYDPASPSTVALVETDMPLAGPQTQNNLKLLGFFGVSAVVLVMLARSMKPQTPLSPNSAG